MQRKSATPVPRDARRGRTAAWLAALVAVSLLVVAGGLWWQRRSEPARRPDVVFLLIDTLRADRLSCYGYPRPTSPFLDSLAADGVLFEDVTCQFSWTRPSMVSLMEGRYLTAYRDAIEDGVPTLPDAFQRAGYRTVGLVANASVNAETGFARGFDHYDSGDLKASGPIYADFLRDVDELSSSLWQPLRTALARDEHGDRPPLFLYLHVMDVHDPYDPYPEFDAALPSTSSAPVLPLDWQRETLRARGAPAADPKAHEQALGELAEERGRYDQGVRHTDQALQRLFARLRELGLLDHTVLAIAADHGEGLWEHLTPSSDAELATLPPAEFFYQKHGASQFQEVLATPLILSGPGVVRGLRVREAVENVDLFPTLLELCDLPRPTGLHGRSLAPVLRGDGEPASLARDFVYSFGVHGNALREVATGLKLIMPRGKALAAGHELQLYDLKSDPEERDDLARARPADVKRLVAAFLAWEQAYPTAASLRDRTVERLKAEQGELLRGLGYTGLDVGGDQ
jgi:arylsulfatase A-like enzyme